MESAASRGVVAAAAAAAVAVAAAATGGAAVTLRRRRRLGEPEIGRGRYPCARYPASSRCRFVPREVLPIFLVSWMWGRVAEREGRWRECCVYLEWRETNRLSRGNRCSFLCFICFLCSERVFFVLFYVVRISSSHFLRKKSSHVRAEYWRDEVFVPLVRVAVHVILLLTPCVGFVCVCATR